MTDETDTTKPMCGARATLLVTLSPDGTATNVGDSLDIASCSAGVAGTNYNIQNVDKSNDVCWTIQK